MSRPGPFAAALVVLLASAAAFAGERGSAVIARAARAALRGSADRAAAGGRPVREWNGSFGALAFGAYRATFAATDLPVCNFTPSCSHFAELALDRFGPLRGALLAADRLTRDHPYAWGWYPVDPALALLADPPSRYGSRP